MKSGSLLLGLLAGFTAGALIGVLYAPDKGSVTRKKISEVGDEYAEELKEKFSDLVDNISRKFEESLQSREDVIDETES
jgi:gas vesicle protein